MVDISGHKTTQLEHKHVIRKFGDKAMFKRFIFIDIIKTC